MNDDADVLVKKLLALDASGEAEVLIVDQMEKQFEDAERDYGRELQSTIGPDKMDTLVKQAGKEISTESERHLSQQIGIDGRDIHLLLRHLREETKHG